MICLHANTHTLIRLVQTELLMNALERVAARFTTMRIAPTLMKTHMMQGPHTQLVITAPLFFDYLSLHNLFIERERDVSVYFYQTLTLFDDLSLHIERGREVSEYISTHFC